MIGMVAYGEAFQSNNDYFMETKGLISGLNGCYFEHYFLISGS